MLSLYQLRAFLELARLGSVQEAADALVVSQPAVSAALAGLQRAVGVKLTERDGRKIRLTESGKAFELYGRRIFALLDEAQRRAHELAAESASRLRVAAVTTAAEHLVPQLLQRFRLREPNIGVELDVGNHVHVWDRLSHWEVDLVLAGRPPLDMRLRTLATRAHELIVIAPAGDAFALMPLGAATWLVREQGSGTRSATEECFAALGIDPPRLSIASNGAIGACVRAGLGYSLVSRDAVERDLRAGLIQQIPTPVTPLDKQWHLVAARDRDLPAAVDRFVAFAIEHYAFVAHTEEPLSRSG
ncbi:MAG: LysR substrate-binding domain-containing protein [Vulcanimicrobiaceae bacterium]